MKLIKCTTVTVTDYCGKQATVTVTVTVTVSSRQAGWLFIFLQDMLLK
jgi:hypothetical protein